MKYILGNIYCWFQSFFGQNLSHFLWGYDPATEAYTNPNLYNIIGIVSLVLSLVIVLLYYYAFNHPRFCRWWSWLITLLANGAIGFALGFVMTNNKLNSELIPNTLRYSIDPETGSETIITSSNCIGFGIANFLVVSLFFICFTFIFKWWSQNAKYVPF